MKRITIKSITLRNWRGEKERTTAFHTDRPTYICGDNGLGKSRHFDAFCWLLFGKDSKDRKDFNLRTYDANHHELHHCECSVEAAISVDGQDITLKREFKELWVKPRGQVEEVFKGNVTECTWDGVPVKVGDYQKRVAQEVIDDTVFKMITNPRYFAEQMKWQLQREVLLEMAGTASDYEIAAGNADFKALLDGLEGKSLADFRKGLAATKKRLKAEASEIQPRIDQTQKMMPEAEDWAALEDEKAAVTGKMAELEAQISDAGERMDALCRERHGIKAEIGELHARQEEAVRRRKAELQEECDRKNGRRRALEAELKKRHAELAEATIDQKRNDERMDYLTMQIGCTDKQLDGLRKEWYGINASAYDGKGDICPCCGQRLPEDKIKEARDKFTALKQERLAGNNQRGKALAAQKAGLQRELEEKRAEGESLKGRVAQADKDIKGLTDTIMAMPVETAPAVSGPEIPEWKALQDRVETLNGRLAQLGGGAPEDGAATGLRERKADLQKQYDGIQARLQKRGQIERAESEIASLAARGRGLAQQIADVEKREYTAAQFSKKKIEDCEQRINNMFRLVRFKLFDYTQDGNEYETCVPLVDGVPYPVANTAKQLNAGLDVINTLCRFNNASAPIFVDGAESVNHYTETDSQVVFLQVTKDKQLTIK